MVNKSRLIRLAQQLIRIDSQNPGGDESRIARLVKNYLEKLGLAVRLYEFSKKRSNVIAYLGNDLKKRSLLISPHLDTVPAGKNWTTPPFSGRRVKNRIYGLGATDCKGNLACALEVISSLVEDGVDLSYNLIFAATADEESGSSLGLIPLLDKAILNPDAALILDADEFDTIVTQKGLLHLKVKIEGKRAHGAYPWLGRNAINKAVEILHELMRRKDAYPHNIYLRPPTMNIGTIRGGDKVNVVADWCEFELDLRFLPRQSAKQILRRLREIVRKHTSRFKIEVQGIQEPYVIDQSHPLVTYLTAAMRKFRMRPQIKGSEGATVITFFQNKRIPAIATGFGARGCAHMANEYAKINNLYRGARVLEEFLKSYSFRNDKCQNSKHKINPNTK